MNIEHKTTEPEPALTLYQKCLAHKIETDHYESTLYIEAGEIANRLVLEYANKFPSCINSFRCRVTGNRWWEIGFAYDPFWQAQAGAGGQGSPQAEKGIVQ